MIFTMELKDNKVKIIRYNKEIHEWITNINKYWISYCHSFFPPLFLHAKDLLIKNEWQEIPALVYTVNLRIMKRGHIFVIHLFIPSH